MDERHRFIGDWLKHEWSISVLCRHYDISRKTGHKWIERFKAEGYEGLDDLSRAPRTHPNSTPEELEAAILEVRLEHPYWGPRKILHRLRRTHPRRMWPATSTLGAILSRNGLVRARRRSRRTPVYRGPFAAGLAPNQVWNADFKGWFRTKDGQRVDPFTVTDSASRYLLHCRAVGKTDYQTVRGHLTAVFQEFGLPDALRTDNGPPFASGGIQGLSRFSVWLMRLKVRPERIRPGHPEENGAHERMHRTLKQETAKPPQTSLKAQQEAFDRFRTVYNEERPHEALGMRTPGQAYRCSTREFPQKLPEMGYPQGMSTRRVAANGTITWQNRMVFVSNALVKEDVGMIRTDEDRWDVFFGGLRLGRIVHRDDRIDIVDQSKV